MTVHLLKLCVGACSVQDMQDWVAMTMANAKRKGLPNTYAAHTKSWPKRADDVLAGGSLYWVVKGVIQLRQRVLGFEQAIHPEHGHPCCKIVLDPELVLTVPSPRRAFQGWRYLEASDAPADLGAGVDADLPAELRAELMQMGIW